MSLSIYFKKYTFLVFFLGLVTFAQLAHAISENDFAVTYRAEVAPYFQTFGVTGSFVGVDHVKINYRSFELAEERGAVVIVEGRSEPIEKYAELIFDLAKKGYSVYIMDHRGQGVSGRMVTNPQVGYVKNFADYVADFSYFMDHVVNAVHHTKRYLLAHSMGGAVAALYLKEHPGSFNAVALSSPMFRLDTHPYSENVAYLIASLNSWIGAGKHYALTQHDWNDHLKFTDSGNHFTLSEVRFDKIMEDFRDRPELTLGGASNQWIKAALDATHQVLKDAHQLRFPILLLQAGQDRVVNVSGQEDFCRAAMSCDKVVFPEAFHETLMERDFIRDVSLARIEQFFSSY